MPNLPFSLNQTISRFYNPLREALLARLIYHQISAFCGNCLYFERNGPRNSTLYKHGIRERSAKTKFISIIFTISKSTYHFNVCYKKHHAASSKLLSKSRIRFSWNIIFAVELFLKVYIPSTFYLSAISSPFLVIHILDSGDYLVRPVQLWITVLC